MRDNIHFDSEQISVCSSKPNRNGPFGEIDCTYIDCLKRLTVPFDVNLPFRPSLQPLETSFDCVRECIRECWAENFEMRPDFKTIRTKLRPLRKGMRPNIFDNMMAVSYSTFL